MTEIESQMIQYYFEVICNSKVYVDTERNVFRTSVMPVLLSNNGPLFSTVLALTAAEWSRRGLHDGVDYENASIHYKVKALSQLQSNLNVVLDTEENVLTCVLQASLEIAEGSQPSWLRHLQGAMDIMNTHGDWVSPDCAALVLQYFRFRYILMKTTENKGEIQDVRGSIQPASEECGEAIEALHRLSATSGAQQTVDPQIGCSMELVELIQSISNASENGASLEKHIRDLDFLATDEYLLKSAECFRFAALIYLHLVVYDAPIRFPSMSTLLQPLIDSLSEVIVADQRRRSFPMWPLFIAGCVSCTEAHRKAVLDLFNLLDSKWPISNISTVTQVMLTIWKIRDLDNGLAPTVQHDWQNIIQKFGWKLSLS
ncbi:hypothetical protein CkaCkLH20_01113 [Colletotrichum karsti]|uniref:Uncharacterized protein n=1 Tax=Colletotrichum karsti TaxID=1095194 RepID=A0A9P6LPC8_9PEZI|nr:uncharacterized protein CkaCkLH20_01113 [Colletotrichum karsti]KAF9880963.1 hypothetical protein CkaCkLH20_01113 [Colletotrichum karsti]